MRWNCGQPVTNGLLACNLKVFFWSGDVLASGFQAKVLDMIRSGVFLAVHSGVCCTTWSRAAHPSYRCNGGLWGHHFKHDPDKAKAVREQFHVDAASSFGIVCCSDLGTPKQFDAVVSQASCGHSETGGSVIPFGALLL